MLIDFEVFEVSEILEFLENEELLKERVKEAEELIESLQLSRPMDRGYVVNWNTQEMIWNRLFGPEMMNISPSDTTLTLTTPYLAPTVCCTNTDEEIFETFGFQAYTAVPSPEMVLHAPPEGVEPPHMSCCQLIVDSGFSFTHAVPFLSQQAIKRGIRRLQVGGKLLTNVLKERVSYRQWNMMDDFLLIDELKKGLCQVSLDFQTQMSQCSRLGSKGTSLTSCPLRQEWILPDFITHTKGRPRESVGPSPLEINQTTAPVSDTRDEQIISLGIERITVPELLFHPSDIGLSQAGVAEMIVHSIQSCPEVMQGLLYENITLSGGNTLFPNFTARLSQELRALMPQEYTLGITSTSAPLLAVWQGASHYATTEAYQQRVVTRAEYLEHGSHLCRQRFDNFSDT